MASIDLLLARWVLNELAPESVPGLAIDALSDGCEAPEVAILAGLVRPTRLDVEEELPALLRRLGLARPSRVEALKAVIDDLAREIVDGSVPPARGAWDIWLWSGRLPEPIDGQVRAFVDLGSDWDGHSEDRMAIEAAIVDEARALLAAGGLRLEPID